MMYFICARLLKFTMAVNELACNMALLTTLTRWLFHELKCTWLSEVLNYDKFFLDENAAFKTEFLTRPPLNSYRS